MAEQKPGGEDLRPDYEIKGPIPNGAGRPIVIQQVEGRRWSWGSRLLLMALLASVMFNFTLYSSYEEYYTDTKPPLERFHSGDRDVPDKIAVITISGTIMPPFTERTLKSIKRAREDEHVKGVVLEIDSPGGLVADSHQIYHALTQLRDTKPIYVSMKRMAASGGVYVAMGAGPEGKIFAEPTTWTGSIGVIIPRYNATELANKLGVTSEPLKTGELKGSMDPFRELSETEKRVWDALLEESFDRFVSIIAENRPSLEYVKVRELATGQIYTAEQAKKIGLIDEIAFKEEVIESLQQHLGLTKVRVVQYASPPALIDLLMGQADAKQPASTLQMFLDATVPRAMYYCSWGPPIPGWE